jgi:methylated-DNA-[protein]-cysteine S-methyltransferase
MSYSFSYNSPLGWLDIVADEEAIVGLRFAEKNSGGDSASPLIQKCIEELDEYFSEKRMEFSVPLKTSGSDFQQKVWKELQTIPFGKTVSYMQVAMQLGDIKSIRAVGTANGRNPIALIIPCHRVIGSDGKLVGYGGGMWRKKWLLDFERKSHQGELF